MKHNMHFALQKAKPRKAIKSIHSVQSNGEFAIKQIILLSHYVGLM
jgi:hypothetical protein